MRIERNRLNPYNPLSYILILSILILSPIIGLIVIWNESDKRNPFKWN